jgi:hypothetical protein
MHSQPNEERQTRRILLLRGANPEILIGFDGPHRTLLTFDIPRKQRVAENLTAALCENCGIHAVSISSLEASLTDSLSAQIHYEIMESLGPADETPSNMHWVPVDALVESAFRDASDFHATRQAIARVGANSEGTTRGLFGRLGWFPELQQWVQDQIAMHGFHLNGRFRQLNASPTFSLIRFETDGPAVWFKAVGEPNQREYTVTLALARCFSRFVPEILAAQPESNGWLAREVEGSLLRECATLPAWEAAAVDLAEFQIRSLGQGLHLLERGARDLRASALAELVEPFFRTIDELMRRQIKIPPSRLSHEQLRSLSAMVKDALAVLEQTAIPPTLGHLDVNPGNIIYSPTGCVFLDWAEAFVGHPFLTLQYLLEHFRRTFGQEHSQEARLVARYTSRWRAIASESDIRRALEVAPLLAVLAYASANDLWADPRKIEEPRIAGYLRSLARRTELEAQRLLDRRVPCLS